MCVHRTLRLTAATPPSGRLLMATLIGVVSMLGAAAGTCTATDHPPLRVHPENPRYFEYRGLPLVLFGHQAGLRGVPVPRQAGTDAAARVSRYGNHFYMTVHPTWVRATFDEVHRTLHDPENWRRVRDLIEAAREHDVIVHLFFWSYKFNYAEQDWSGSDMIWTDPDDDGGVVVGRDVTRRDLHRLAIDNAVEHTADLPNVVYNFMWEYNVRVPGKDPDGEFHRWWARTFRETFARAVPGRDPLISIKFGRRHPRERGADFVVEEDGNGFFYRHPHTTVLEHGVPAVFISSDFVFADNVFRGWDRVPWNPRVWERGQVRDYRITPDDLRAMVTEGFHPAETWQSAQEETLNYYLQMRWYLENLPTWRNEPGRGIAADALPRYVPSQRPTLSNPPGYTNGRNGRSYAAIYAHPEGLPPAQAEVWIDVNGDGRFETDPAAGERIAMQPQGDDYKEGVLFTAEGPKEGRYVFRFADRNWNPPRAGGLVRGRSEGITYRAWE
jgi:hypothetical protein